MGKHRKPEKIETNELCCKGCGKQARYQTASGLLLCESSTNSCSTMKAKNSLGLKNSYKNGRTRSDFGGKRPLAKGLTAVSDDRIKANVKYDKDDIWGVNKKGPHKKLLLKERGHQCESCKLDHWLDKPITIELDHINGDRNDNRKENLQLLCPNCHSMTPTWKIGKIRLNKRKRSDEEIITAWKNSTSMNKTLQKLDYGWGNVELVRTVLRSYNLL